MTTPEIFCCKVGPCDAIPRITELAREAAEWKACAERIDAKMLAEQADHNKTVDKLIELKRESAAKDALCQRYRDALQQMKDVAENADETGYVDGVGFVNTDKLHEEVETLLKLSPASAYQEIAALRNKASLLDMAYDSLCGIVGDMTPEQLAYHEANPPFEETNYALARAARTIKAIDAAMGHGNGAQNKG